MDHKEAGNAAFARSQWHEAAQHYTAALQAEPEMVAALANRAACAIQLKQFEDALNDCNAALDTGTAPVPLQIKILWRKAVSLRNLGRDKPAWEATVRAGLDLDPTNEKLLAETHYVFVVNTVPPNYTQQNTQSRNTQNRSTQSPTLNTHSPQSTNSTPVFPPLPITYAGVLRLLRSESPEVHDFWYANVSGPDLQRALAKAGVEPDTLDYMFRLISSHPENLQRNKEYMEALQASPRFDTALLMADAAAHFGAVAVLNTSA